MMNARFRDDFMVYIAKHESDFPHDRYTLAEERNRFTRLLSGAKHIFDQRIRTQSLRRVEVRIRYRDIIGQC